MSSLNFKSTAVSKIALILTYFRSLYFIPPKQAMHEAKQGIKSLFKDLLVLDFLSLTLGALTSLGETILRFLIIIGMLNFVCLIFSPFFFVAYWTIGKLTKLSNFAIDMNNLLTDYFQLCTVNIYNISLVIVSVVAFLFWFKNKKRSYGDRRR